ncbi:o-succinylbenzoate synthase [Natroniella sulfidigena]|uniref:o-succinylbenzoate synthase n=1 Tax=Natroniella sulfidigena TaxID=723921 RepID=UPI00200AF341|nr:o-succinylbenzoate synthase [Natroniella sulfidigena]MCK8817889.1 o-succinylbenzoate synthase [Natroniella sulfidigena]
MKLSKVILREIGMKMKNPFVTGSGKEDERRLIIVEAHSEQGIGYGEVSALSAPYYTEETTQTSWYVLKEFLLPLAFKEEWDKPVQLAELLEQVRRHHMAKAGLEGAVWDLYARENNTSLISLLNGKSRAVPSGVSVGIYPDLDQLVEVVGDYLELGYQRIKIKIKPGWDKKPLQALREKYGNFPLMVDANASYTLADANRLKRLDRFGLMMIEQPLAQDDIIDHAKLQQVIGTPICLDESIESVAQARKAIELGSCQIINIKIARVGGLRQALLIHQLCQEREVPVWCGGMLESGVGRAHALALSSLPGFSLPGDISASARYWEEDIITPEVTLSEDGYIELPTGPGLGFKVKRDLLEEYTVRKEEFVN